MQSRHRSKTCTTRPFKGGVGPFKTREDQLHEQLYEPGPIHILHEQYVIEHTKHALMRPPCEAIEKKRRSEVIFHNDTAAAIIILAHTRKSAASANSRVRVGISRRLAIGRQSNRLHILCCSHVELQGAFNLRSIRVKGRPVLLISNSLMRFPC